MPETNDEIEIYIPDLLHSIWELHWIVLFLMILGALGGHCCPTAGYHPMKQKLP